MNRVLARHTGQKIAKIARDTERDHFMSSEEARKYGIVDQVLSTRADGPAPGGERRP